MHRRWGIAVTYCQSRPLQGFGNHAPLPLGPPTQAVRSTFAFSRVTHFIGSADSDCLCKVLPHCVYSRVARWKGMDWIASLPGPMNLFMAKVKPPKSPLLRPILFVAIWTEASL